jgi:hypothetical protein
MYTSTRTINQHLRFVCFQHMATIPASLRARLIFQMLPASLLESTPDPILYQLVKVLNVEADLAGTCSLRV